MFTDLLDLPVRSAKPRAVGMTMAIDSGLPAGLFEDAVATAADWIDIIKFGWGTALVTPDLDRKLDCLREAGVDFYLGGTLFEKFVVQDRFDGFLRLCERLGTHTIEISNGTIDMSNAAKCAYIRKCCTDFRVISEVGFKDADRSLRLSPSKWVDFINQDMDAGASLVITEARESGKSGICRADGELRFGLIEDILTSGLPPERLIFEAPNKDLQTYFIQRVGANVNLGNICPTDMIGLETLRVGLRADTLAHFEDKRAEAGDA
jgi:phosphosulfolactate synthase